MNMLNNANYEGTFNSTDTFGYWAASLSLSSSTIHSGTQSLQVTSTETSHTDGMIHMAPLTNLVPAGFPIVGTSMWIWVPTGTSVLVGNRILDATRTELAEATVSQTVVGNNAWQNVSLAKWTYASANFIPGIQAHLTSAVSGITFYVDDISVSALVSNTPYLHFM